MRHILRLWKQTLNNLPYSKYDEVLKIQQPVYQVITACDTVTIGTFDVVAPM